MNFNNELSMKEFIIFLLPSIAVMAFMSTYAIVDGFFISRYAGSEALAAVNLVLPINSVIYSVGLMFAAGGGAFASIKLGEGDKNAASKFFSNLLVVSIAFGLIAMILGLLFKDSILSFLGVDASLHPYASTYGIYVMATFPFLITKMIFAGFLRAGGKPKISLRMSVFGGAINMILDIILIGFLGLGVAGAGIATLVGIVSSLIYASRYFLREESIIRFQFAPLDFKLLLDSMINGSSEMISELAIGFTTLVLNTLTLRYLGNEGVAAIAVILYINFFASMVFQGIAIGVAPLLSFHYGAKNYELLKTIRRYSSMVLLFVSLFIVAGVLLANQRLVSIFFSSDQVAFKLASQGLVYVAFAYLFMGGNMYGSAMYTALANDKVSALISITKTFFVFSFMAYILPKTFGIQGLWLVVPTTELLTGIMVFYLTRERQLNRFVKMNVNQVPSPM